MNERMRKNLLKWFDGLDRRKMLRVLPDAAYIKIRYALKFNKKLNLKNPVTYNEKLQ